MLADLERLIELQQVDLRLQELRQHIELFPRRRQETEQELKRARDYVAQLRQRHTDSLKERKKLELDVQQLDEKISKHKEQMYEVKSNEAYRALQHEIEEEQQKKTQAEDRVLDAMIALEELETQIKQGEAELAGVEKRTGETLRELGQEEAVRTAEAAELSAQRDGLRSGISDDTLVIYDRIARAHGGLALAEARDEVCQACRIHIRPQVYSELKRNEQIYYCESCHRILYYIPVPQSGIEQPVSAG
ncbi:MAG: hypothetical protein HYY26_00915 [Acidobacteria bacterium]|nr:hypothetical protein [Acidobacteriota bacterium]